GLCFFYAAPMRLMVWAVTSLFVVVTVTNLEGRWKDTRLNKFLWGAAAGVIGGGVSALLSVGIYLSWNWWIPWLCLWVDGIALGALIGFVESIAPAAPPEKKVSA